jgi:L-asparaginase/Glu-tRNA(Gln) amidotransferase subunit D
MFFDPREFLVHGMLGNLYIKVFGGTLASEKDKATGFTVPKHGKVDELVKYQLPRDIRDLYRSIIVEEEGVFLDSANYRANSLEAMVAAARKHFRGRSGNLLGVCGTDGLEAGSHACADGLTQELMGDASFNIVVAQRAGPERPPNTIWPIDQQGTDAARNLMHGIYHSTLAETRGKVTVTAHDSLFSARGLRKINTAKPQPFESRYDPLLQCANVEAELPRWLPGRLSDETRNDALPTSTGGRFNLVQGIETMTLDTLADYQNLLAFMDGGIRRGTLKGVVVQVLGSSNPRDYPEDKAALLEAAEMGEPHSIPVIIVSEPVQPRKPKNGKKRSMYAGHVSRLGGKVINGGELTKTETKLVAAQVLHRVMRVEGRTGEEVRRLVAAALCEYEQFVNGDLSVDQYIRTKMDKFQV